MTTRITRPPTMLMWSVSFSPSWNWMGNSFSPMSLARPPVAAMLPAVSEASEVVSRFCAWPLAAMSCPFLSTRKTTLAFASRVSRSQIPAMSRNSSSYITRPEFMFLRSPRRYRVPRPNTKETLGIQSSSPPDQQRVAEAEVDADGSAVLSTLVPVGPDHHHQPGRGPAWRCSPPRRDQDRLTGRKRPGAGRYRASRRRPAPARPPGRRRRRRRWAAPR